MEQLELINNELKTKKCSKCKEIKILDAFHRNRSMPDGRGYWCKECKKSPPKPDRDRQATIDRINGYKICNRCLIKKDLSGFYFSRTSDHYNPRCICCVNKNQYEKYGLTHIRIAGKRLEIDTKNGYKICNKCNQKKDLSNYLIDKRFNLYCCICNECGNKKTNRNRNLRRKTNENYRLRTNLHKSIRRVLSGKRKWAKTMELIGLSLDDFKKYIATQFKDGMTWENRGYGKNSWHLDHKLPCNLFNLEDIRHQKVCFHYTNLQPLWQKDNIGKSDILPDGRSAQDMTGLEKKEYLISIGYPHLFD